MDLSNEVLTQAFQQVKANLEIEGLHLPDHAFELFVKKIRGEISEDKFKQIVLEIAKT